MGEQMGKVDPRVPLQSLSGVRCRMDSLQRFLSEAVNSNTLIGQPQMEMVSAEISSAVQQIILNGAALLASIPPPPDPILIPKPGGGEELREEEEEGFRSSESGVVEIDAVELLAEHVHLCEICGKGFKRDANLRMHMRAHGNQFKTPEALAKPTTTTNESSQFGKRSGGGTKFSCPYEGCNRNKRHNKFRPLKSVVCVRNHFKRIHCPKMYSCQRCNKKSFSVEADLKSHLKHCGESRWKCTCGTSFSRKDKLFGHMALFEGHMPAVVPEEEESKRKVEEVEDRFEFFDGFGFIDDDGFGLNDVWSSPNLGGIDGFYGSVFGQ